MLRLQTEYTSISLGKPLQCPPCLIPVLVALSFPDSTALAPQRLRKTGKGLPQDPKLPRTTLLVACFYAAKDWSL